MGTAALVFPRFFYFLMYLVFAPCISPIMLYSSIGLRVLVPH